MEPRAASEGVAMKAEQLKRDGYVHFSERRFLAAIDACTEAIALCPDVAKYYTNRALCHLKMNDWAKVEYDSRKAIELDRDSVKGHYFLGLALLEGNELKFAEGIKELEKALDLDRDAYPRYKIERIWQPLARAKYLMWEQERSRELEIWQRVCELAHSHVLELSTTEGFLDEANDARLKHMEAVRQVLIKAAKDDEATDVPHRLCCGITFEILRDPVTTPSGVSYERKNILKHLRQGREFDPMTREALKASQLRPNKALRELVKAYLDEHGWAYKTTIEDNYVWI